MNTSIRLFALAAIVLGLWCEGRAAQSESDRSQLLELLRRPRFHYEIGVGGQSRTGLNLMEDKWSASREITTLEVSLRTSPDDAPTLLRLAELARMTGDTEVASNAVRRAKAIFRQKLDRQPGDAELLLNLGNALLCDSDYAEAIPCLRRAIQARPEHWQAWGSLGMALGGDAFDLLSEPFVTNLPPGNNGFARLLQLIRKNPPSAGATAKARERMSEALACGDKLVSLAPTNAAAYLRRADIGCSVGFAQMLLESARREVGADEVLRFSVVTTNNLRDIRRAAELAPSSYRIVAVAALVEIFHEAIRHGLQSLERLFRDKAFNELPAAAQQSFRQQLDRLEQIGRGRDTNAASAALEYRGTLQMIVMEDVQGSFASFRRAVVLDPWRESAWDGYMGVLSMRDNDEEMFNVAEARLAKTNTWRNRLLVASSAADLKKMDRAIEEARNAVRLAPHHPMPHHTLGVVIATRSQDQESIQEALERLDMAGRHMTPENTSAEVALEFFRNMSVVATLAAQFDLADRLLGNAFQIDPKNEDLEKLKQLIARAKPK